MPVVSMVRSRVWLERRFIIYPDDYQMIPVMLMLFDVFVSTKGGCWAGIYLASRMNFA